MGNRLLTVPALENGQSGTVIKIELDGKIRRRLIEMGLTPGTRVTLTKRAPLGDPIEIRLRGYELTLRGNDAAKILVVPEKA